MANKFASFKSTKADHSGKEVLVLGSGHVCSPLIEYLLRDKSLVITLGKIVHSYNTYIPDNIQFLS